MFALAVGSLLAWRLASEAAGAAPASFPLARSYQSFVPASPCPFTEAEAPAVEEEHVVLANSEAELRYRAHLSLYEVFAGCNRAGLCT